jgi:ribonucleotide reductase alpha subunit
MYAMRAINVDTRPMSTFASTIMNGKYAHTKPSGHKETWSEISYRVSHSVMEKYVSPSIVKTVYSFIDKRQLMPGGRYLYAAGRKYPQINNCYLFIAEDSREGWADTMFKNTSSLMTGGGVGNVYSKLREEGALVGGMGGTSTGPIALMQMVNEAGRHIMQGGSRRCLPSYTQVTMSDYSKKRIDEIQVGDEVLTRFGPKKVTNVFDQGEQDILEIKTTYGIVFSSCKHKWLSSNSSRTKTFHITADKLALSHKLYYHPTPKVLGGKELDTDVAYAIGFYLGNGCAYSSNRTHEVTLQIDKPKYNHKQIDYLCKAMSKLDATNPVTRKGHGEVTEIRCRGKDLVAKFQKWKSPHQAFDIPQIIKDSSLEARYAFIAGWFDADGYYGKDSWKLSNKHSSVRTKLIKFLSDLGFESTENGMEVRISSYQFPQWRNTVLKYAFKRPRGRSFERSTSEIPANIIGIRTLDKQPTYDIEVEDVHEFIADNFVSHNSAIWAGLHWWHPDVFKFIQLKDWSDEVKALKLKDFNFPAAMDMTNISVALDGEFFQAFENPYHSKHSHAVKVYWMAVRHMCETGEPGFSIDTDENEGEWGRNAPVTADTNVLTKDGYKSVKELVGKPTSLWTGKQWADNVEFKLTKKQADIVKVKMTGGRTLRCDPEHPVLIEKWQGAGDRRHMVGTERVAAGRLRAGDVVHVSMPNVDSTQIDVEAYTLGYLYGDGSFTNSRAEATLCTNESKGCLTVLSQSAHLSSVTQCDSRGYTRCYYKKHQYFKNRNKDTYPTDVSDSSSKSASFIAGLFDSDGSYDKKQQRVRLSSIHKSFLLGVQRQLEQLGILSHLTTGGISTYGQKLGYTLGIASGYVKEFARLIPTVRLKIDAESYFSYRKSVVKVLSVEPDGKEDVFCCDVGVEEHSFQAEGVIISNCTEVTTPDDSDMCNLSSLNLARFNTVDEFEDAVYHATCFLLCGTMYSPLPIPSMYKVREKNRRLGLGLMGIHEWLLRRGYKYGPNQELEKWLQAYERASDYAKYWASNVFGISVPVKTRAVAPTGTISIVAETTSGLEPIFAAAQKRRYMSQDNSKNWCYQYIIDACAERLISDGVDPDSIEDAYDLAEDIERRVEMQSWIQRYVDHSISSTINMPSWGSSCNNPNTVDSFGKKNFGDKLATSIGTKVIINKCGR